MSLLNNVLLKTNQGSTRNQRGNHKILCNKWKWKHNCPKSTGYGKSDSEREVFRDTVLPWQMRKISNKQLNLPSKGIRKTRINKVQSQQKEGNNRNHRGDI